MALRCSCKAEIVGSSPTSSSKINVVGSLMDRTPLTSAARLFDSVNSGLSGSNDGNAGSIPVPQHTALWCNGNMKDFESFDPSSILGGASRISCGRGVRKRPGATKSLL